MENRENQRPETSQQNQQQPTSQDGGSSTGSTPPTGGQNETDGSELGQNGQSSNADQSSEASQSGGAFDSQQPSETGQADYGQSGQSDTLTQQRSDVEGSAGQTPETGSEAGFMGQQDGTDPSSELVEGEQDFEKDGQGSIEGQ